MQMKVNLFFKISAIVFVLISSFSMDVNAQNHLIRAHIDTLLTLLPEAPDTLIKDHPMFETPNVHPQKTFELTQLYYDKSVPIRVLQFKLQDYSINKDYYREQAIEVFNLDDEFKINRSDSLMGFPAHFYNDKNRTSITMFLGEYIIIELKLEGSDWELIQLATFLERFPLIAIKERFLLVSKLYRGTKIIKK